MNALLFLAFLALVGLVIAWARDFRRAWRDGQRKADELDRVVRREGSR